jgi:multimeric flavodoxin WrbA
MKILGFVGSPRKKGNTSTLVNEVMRGAQGGSAETRVYYLNEMNIRGCQGCRTCKKTEGRCALKDDMAPLYAEIRDADAVVVGTPIYMCQVTGQTKLFIDRLYTFLNDDFSHRLGAGKKTLMVYTQGQPNPGTFQASIDLNNMVLAMLGFKVQDTLVAGSNRSPDDILKNQEIMEKAYQAGHSLAAAQA